MTEIEAGMITIVIDVDLPVAMDVDLPMTIVTDEEATMVAGEATTTVAAATITGLPEEDPVVALLPTTITTAPQVHEVEILMVHPAVGVAPRLTFAAAAVAAIATAGTMVFQEFLCWFATLARTSPTMTLELPSDASVMFVTSTSRGTTTRSKLKALLSSSMPIPSRLARRVTR